MIEQKRSTKVALSLLLLSSLATMSAGTAIRAGDQQKLDHASLLRHAIKVESNNLLRSRYLEGGADEGEAQGEQQGEQQNGEQNENRDENQNDEQENEDENEQQNEANEEQEDQNGDVEQNEQEEGQENNEQQDNGGEYQEEAQYDDQYQAPQIDFFKCVALSIQPDVVDVETMLANGEIDDDQAAQLENTYITEMLPDLNLNTQESVVFFTYGYGEDDENREVYMVSINDWIAASSGYEQTCNALDEDDAEEVLSQVPSYFTSQMEAQSGLMLYSGFNCNADGSGFKSQLFLDETCTTFSRTMKNYYPFRKSNNGSTEVTSDMTTYMIQDASDSVSYSQYCDGSEFCEKILKNSVGLLDCEAGEEEPEEEEEAQDVEGEGEGRKLTTYQLEYDMASAIGDSCPYIQTTFSIDQEYDFSVDDLEAIVKHWSNTANGGQDSDRRSLVPGANDVWVYLVGVLAILCIGSSLVVSRSKCQPHRMLKTSGSDTDDTADSKREPLVIKRTTKPIRKLPRDTSDIEQSFSAIECTLSKKKQRPRKSQEQNPEKRKTKNKPIRQFLKKSASSMSNAISVE